MTTLSIASARANFSRIVDSAMTTHERFEVTRNGERAAVLLGADDYDSLIETIEVLADPGALADIREAQAAIARGETFSEAEVRDALARRRAP